MAGNFIDESGHNCSVRRFLPHHIKIMKVALVSVHHHDHISSCCCSPQALAIIRQKPEGISSREYTERLALQFSELQVDWRERVLQLQQELLRTRQELTRFQIQAETLDLAHHSHTAGG
jgi:hypothetical protein